MPVPDYQKFFHPILTCISDGKEHRIRDIYEDLADIFGLTEDDRAELLPSGSQQVYKNRIGWAKTYLKKAGLITSPRRGIIRITERGRGVLQENPKLVDTAYLKKFEEFQVFFGANTDRSDTIKEKTAIISDQTPQEIIGLNYWKIHNQVADELLEQIGNCTPAFFERLVLDLLVAMGYGGSRQDAAEAVNRSGDGGIDGIIKEDKLGLDVILMQAKRLKNTVGIPEIQALVWSLTGNRVKKGVFITTSKFSREAQEYVKRIEQRVVLIDGKQLSGLMIDHDIGVSEEERYIIKRIDMDYFEGN
jgi:restriction system protein